MEKKENSKTEERTEGKQRVTGAWGNQAILAGSSQVMINYGSPESMMSDWNYEPGRDP